MTDAASLPCSDACPAEVHLGDCLDVLDRIATPAEGFRLVYLDPPFNTGRTHRASNGRFEDTWPDIPAYLEWLRLRVSRAIDCMHEDGVILLHCDWRTCHHLRLMLDDLLGPERFVNHLIWQYGLGGSSPRRFARKHDDILFYARSDGYCFEPPRVEATSERLRGQFKKATDVLDVPAINNMASERVGWPTQKPLALLELLIGACCPPDGAVLDPCCGSGTTLVAARRLGRASVGIDRSEQAVAIARQRLADIAPASGDGTPVMA